VRALTDNMLILTCFITIKFRSNLSGKKILTGIQHHHARGKVSPTSTTASLSLTLEVTAHADDKGIRAPYLCTKLEVYRPSSHSKDMTTFDLSISRPGDLYLLTLKLVRFIACGVGNLPTNFGVSRAFHYRLVGQQLQTDHVTLTLEVTALVGDKGLCAPSVYQV